MKLTIESLQVFNQLENGLDFSLNPATFDNYTNIRANVGDQVKQVTVFTLVDILQYPGRFRYCSGNRKF